MPETQYRVYILTDPENGKLYTGMTNNLQRRVREHKAGRGSVFTRKYKVSKLVYFEACPDFKTAMAREKQIKTRPRQKKIDLIDQLNPAWDDMFAGLGAVLELENGKTATPEAARQSLSDRQRA